jgi:hypothetical protein
MLTDLREPAVGVSWHAVNSTPALPSGAASLAGAKFRCKRDGGIRYRPNKAALFAVNAGGTTSRPPRPARVG